MDELICTKQEPPDPLVHVEVENAPKLVVNETCTLGALSAVCAVTVEVEEEPVAGTELGLTDRMRVLVTAEQPEAAFVHRGLPENVLDEPA